MDVTPHPWPLCSYLELGALPTAVPCARLHARHLVWEWGLNGLAASTELLVSELVTNAVKATAGNDDQAAICLRLSGDNARVLIEVWDADPQPPVPKDLGQDGTPDPQEEGGRGLFLVAALSTRWAWYLTEKPTGKVVWCELSAEPPEPSAGARSAPQALLPRRMPREQQKHPIEVMRDPDVLRRLRDRLRDLSLVGPQHCHDGGGSGGALRLLPLLSRDDLWSFTAPSAGSVHRFAGAVLAIALPSSGPPLPIHRRSIPNARA